MARCSFTRYPLLGLLLISLLSGGCATLARDEYVAPQTDLPDSWSNEAAQQKEILRAGKFWEEFQDPILNLLIEEALQRNNDILAAAIQVQRARLEAGISRTDLYPKPSAGADVKRSYDLDNDTSGRSYGLSAGISYEVDLWNRYADSYQAAGIEVEASIADRKSAELSVIGNLAELYWQIGYLKQSISLSRDSIANAEQLQRIVESKYAAGSADQADLLKSRQNLLSLQAGLTQEQQSLNEARHALAILFDRPPQEPATEPDNLPESPLPTITAGIPAEILGNRPDLLAAERRLRKSHAEIAITKASYYPSITLTGNFGTSSTQLRDILGNPLATLGSSLVLPFLQWDLTKLNIQVAETTYREAVVNFRTTLYTALAEVENLLSARSQDLEQGELLQQVLNLAVRSEQISERRYQAGAEDLRTLLEEQDSRRSAEKEVLENRFRQLKETMQLYLALGGDISTDLLTGPDRQAAYQPTDNHQQ